MNRSTLTKVKRISAVVISVVMIAFVLFSFFYIVAEADHECDGEHCHICECIEVCTTLLQKFGFKSASSSTFTAAALIGIYAVLLHAGTFTGKTPVTLKVQLNN